jgi:carbon-monoxide dehydrogenase small subunit
VHHEADVWAGESLLVTLRDRLELPGSKNACEQGECGSCSVLLDGDLVCSCLVLAAQADGHAVRTVEGLADGDGCIPCRRRSPRREQSSAASVRPASSSPLRSPQSRPRPDDDEIREALSGNLCRCTGYSKILDAVHAAAGR